MQNRLVWKLTLKIRVYWNWERSKAESMKQVIGPGWFFWHKKMIFTISLHWSLFGQIVKWQTATVAELLFIIIIIIILLCKWTNLTFKCTKYLQFL